MPETGKTEMMLESISAACNSNSLLRHIISAHSLIFMHFFWTLMMIINNSRGRGQVRK